MTIRSPASRCRLTQASVNGRTVAASSWFITFPPHHPDYGGREGFCGGDGRAAEVSKPNVGVGAGHVELGSPRRVVRRQEGRKAPAYNRLMKADVTVRLVGTAVGKGVLAEFTATQLDAEGHGMHRRPGAGPVT
ncbi:hypothetical protein [Streptomyces anulatus]|uniref:hypothetical protein n=1 Tax=Streptomyces anulatus TaxID=1892 RepID=UPI002255CAD4|nr:hypothetical protein [Streptomyces anulatus]MCX4486850.1 hypothetical protein [Streptomyces anulatus]WTD30567.1 hypothetical protein OH737_03195 [Streptomyces anulatus]